MVEIFTVIKIFRIRLYFFNSFQKRAQIKFDLVLLRYRWYLGV